VERLAADLRAEFPGIQGFSSQNLWYMRQFYLAYHGTKNSNRWLEKSVGLSTWSFLANVRTPSNVSSYIRMRKKFGWTKNVLIHQMKTRVTRRPCSARQLRQGPDAKAACQASWPSGTNKSAATPIAFHLTLRLYLQIRKLQT